jgi:hypothetical protein
VTPLFLREREQRDAVGVAAFAALFLVLGAATLLTYLLGRGTDFELGFGSIWTVLGLIVAIVHGVNALRSRHAARRSAASSARTAEPAAVASQGRGFSWPRRQLGR